MTPGHRPITDGEVGVYGLSVSGLGPRAAAFCAEPDPYAPALEVRRVRTGPVVGVPSTLTDDRATIPTLEEGLLEVTRSPAVATYHLGRDLSDEEMLHPWLVPAAATVSAWHGRHVLHGGLLGTGGRCVALIGDKEAGKSSLLAWLALEEGLEVLADDLVVLEGGRAQVGPRCVDLRPASAGLLPRVHAAGLVRDGTRLRLPLPPAAGGAELVGFVVLEWSGGRAGLEPVAAGARLGAVLPHALVEGMPLGHKGVLGYVKHAVWRLRRRREPGSLPECATLLRGLLDV